MPERDRPHPTDFGVAVIVGVVREPFLVRAERDPISVETALSAGLGIDGEPIPLPNEPKEHAL